MTPQEIAIPVDSQKLADELKEICIKYGLLYNKKSNGFQYDKDYKNTFYYSDRHIGLTIGWFIYYTPEGQKITKEQFIELLDNIKK